MSRMIRGSAVLFAFSLVAACSDVTSPTPFAQTARLSGGGGGGGGGGTVTPPSSCVPQISAFDNTPGYGPYSPVVADIRTRVTVKNCSSSAVTLQARVTYQGVFWGGSTFNFPVTCAMIIGANSSLTCQLREKYLFIQQTYHVIFDVLDASGAVVATSSADVDTPLVPNPAPPI